MKNRYLMPLMAALLLTAAGCDNSEFTEPAFLHIDAMKLEVPTMNAVSTDTGFYTSSITGVYVVMKRPGIMKEDTLGLFNLPFTTPILYNGQADYLTLSPAVRMSGKMEFTPYYTFYKRLTIKDPVFAIGDTLDLGTCATTYDITMHDMRLFEPFEPTEGTLKFDSVMQWERNAPGEARSGKGYGYVHLADTETHKFFTLTDSFYVTDPTKLVYLELDTRSDLDFEVYMYTSEMAGGNRKRYPVMTVYRSDEWKHLYINLGPTWRDVNHNPEFWLHFAAINTEKKGGDVRLDNVKLITTSKTL